MNNDQTPKRAFTSEDLARAREARLESVSPENYEIDPKRKALGHDDSWIRSKLGAVPSHYRSRMYKAFHGELSSKKAIEAMCIQCVGYEKPRESIADCKGAMCPLYAYRPYKKPERDAE